MKFGPYGKENIEHVERRLQEYEEALSSKEFTHLEECLVCESVTERDNAPIVFSKSKKIINSLENDDEQAES